MRTGIIQLMERKNQKMIYCIQLSTLCLGLSFMKVIAGVHGTTICSPGCESELKRFCCLFAEEAVGSFSRMLIAMK